MPQIKAYSKKWNIKDESVVLFFYRDLSTTPNPEVKSQDIDEVLSLAKEDNFQGERYSIVKVRPSEGNSLGQRVFLIGLGEKKEARGHHLRSAVGHFIRRLHLALQKIVLVLPSAEDLREDYLRLAQLTTEGILLGLYRFEKYLSAADQKKHQDKAAKAYFLFSQEGSPKEIRDGIDRGTIFSEATLMVRDLVNEGASVVTPEYLAEVAQKMATQHKSITVKIFDEKKLEKENFGGIYGVGRGSANPPRFIRLVYTPEEKVKKRIAIVGKGVTFDTGGVNIKPTTGIETMKEDMSGGGAVLGIFAALPHLKPNVQVIGLIPAAENMVDGLSYKPGDILTTYGGKTIEVINTDAEGRLLLADALGYCVKNEKVDQIIDMATLTGAAALALGPKYAIGFFTDGGLRDSLIKSGKKAGERIWELPLEKEYIKDLKSEFADIKNAPITRLAGTITGALFLHFFLDGKEVPWAHLDIAPCAWSKQYNGHIAYGGTGIAVRTLLEHIASV